MRRAQTASSAGPALPLAPAWLPHWPPRTPRPSARWNAFRQRQRPLPCCLRSGKGGCRAGQLPAPEGGSLGERRQAVLT